MTRQELRDADIDCTPEKYNQAMVSSVCFIGMIVIVVLAVLFGERSITTVKPQPTTEIAINR